MSPTATEPSTAPPFELGVVLAGAVSAGAYTSGVMDFLLEALQAWEDTWARGEQVPPHTVRLRVVAGASAGGMTAAITAAALGEQIPRAPRDPAEGLSGNRFYRAWVQQIDARRLLGLDDLADPAAPATSLLDSSVLDDICTQALGGMTGHVIDRPFVADPLELILTVANLQGVPYKIRFTGAANRGHAIVLHADHTRFLRSRTSPDRAGTWWLDPANGGHEGWRRLGEAALATGAFPLGLVPRYLKRPRGDYDSLRWRIPGQGAAGEPCYNEEHIPPDWPVSAGDNGEYPFLAVDGGLIDNEPLELARRALAGEERCNPRTPERVHRSVLLVDPFSAAAWEGTVPEPRSYDLVEVFKLMFGTLVEQARFKPEELTLAQNENVYSRFMLTPTRSLGDGQAPHPIASGMLGGFGGFLSERFRNHDFHLGRRNCQRFLQRYFVLPLEAARQNPVFADTSEATFQRYSFTKNGKDYYPILPLCGSAASEIWRTPWASLAMLDREVQEIETLLTRRLQAVLARICERRVESRLLATGLKTFIRFKRKDWAGAMMNGVRKGLKEYSLDEHGLRRR
jgi:hypothetical protein